MDTISKKESSVPIVDCLLRSKKTMSETLYFLNPLSLFNWTTMFAGKPWESQSGDCSSSATAGAGDNNFPQNPPSSPSPPPPPLPKFPLPPPPPLLRNDDGRFEIRKRKKDAAEEAEATARDFARFLRRRSFGGASVSRLLLHFMDGTRGDGEEIRGRQEEGRDKSFRRVQIEVELVVPGISWPLTEKAAMAWKERARIRFQREDAEVSAKACTVCLDFVSKFLSTSFCFWYLQTNNVTFFLDGNSMHVHRQDAKLRRDKFVAMCMCKGPLFGNSLGATLAAYPGLAIYWKSRKKSEITRRGIFCILYV